MEQMDISSDTLFKLLNAHREGNKKLVENTILTFMSLLYSMEDGAVFNTSSFTIEKVGDLYSLSWKPGTNRDLFAESVVFSLEDTRLVNLNI